MKSSSQHDQTAVLNGWSFSLMNMTYCLYYYLTTGLYFLLYPLISLCFYLTGRRTGRWEERFGRYPRNTARTRSGLPRIWFHAASVGEVQVTSIILDALLKMRPECDVVISTITRHGRDLAQRTAESRRWSVRPSVIYAPLDFPLAVRTACKTLRPDILVCVETEIWPNLLITAQQMGIKTAMVNGRVSIRTIKGYLKIRRLIAAVLNHMDAFSMARPVDGERIVRLGANPDKVKINGNAKYDLLIRQTDPSGFKDREEKLFQFRPGQPVWIAGSTRHNEEEIIVSAYKKVIGKLPETRLIIAPRHVGRAERIKKMIFRQGLACRLRTELKDDSPVLTAPIVILDTIGELQSLYRKASIVFCGASLVPKGGQNILEPAAWGKPVLYGPSMEDFSDAKELLERKHAAVPVQNGDELAAEVIHYLSHPEEAEKIGSAAEKALLSMKGGGAAHAAVVSDLLDETT